MTLNLDIPWVEKYRPETFKDIVSQNIAINSLKEFVLSSGNMPHMIFTGPAGTGKTSTALIIAKALLKGDNYHSSLLELNASDTVRMDFVRDVLKEFVNQNKIIGKGSLKLVLLDEADNIPTQVQQALRRIIEKASTNVKFIFMCNYINRIIDPIISRCAVFRFVNLSKDRIVERLEFIAKNENVSIPKDKKDLFLDTLFFISGGDLRKAINTLQMSVALELLKDDLDIDEVLNISGFISRDVLDELIRALQNKNFTKAKEIFQSIDNHDSRNLIRQILAKLSDIEGITVKNRAKILAFIGNIDYKISQGGDEEIQIMALFAEIIENMNT